MKVKGIITETLTVQKEIELDLPDNSSEEHIEQVVRNRAYEKLVSTDTGWEVLDCSSCDVVIEYESITIPQTVN